MLFAAEADHVTGRLARAADGFAAARRTFRRLGGAFRKGGDRAGASSASVVLGEDLARAETALLDAGHWIGALVARARALPHARAAALLERRLPRYPRVLREGESGDLRGAHTRLLRDVARCFDATYPDADGPLRVHQSLPSFSSVAVVE